MLLRILRSLGVVARSRSRRDAKMLLLTLLFLRTVRFVCASSRSFGMLRRVAVV